MEIQNGRWKIVTTVVILLIFFVFVKTSGDEPSPVKQSPNWASRTSRRQPSCGFRRAYSYKSILDDLRVKAAFLKKPRVASWEGLKDQRQDRYHRPFPTHAKYSKKGCERNDLECPCIPRRSVERGRPTGAMTPHSLPWMMYVENDKGMKCSGFLISYYFGVTAGQCIRGTKYVNVTMGAFDLTKPEREGVFRLTVYAHNYKINPAFESDTMRADVAVLKLAYGVNGVLMYFKDNIAPACPTKGLLPGYSFPRSFLRCFGAGWGLTLREGRVVLPAELKWQRSIIVRETSGFIYTISRWGKITDGPCAWDTGSPLMCFDLDGVTRVMGISKSGADKCEQAHFFAKYISVSDSLPWINILLKEFRDSRAHWNISADPMEEWIQNHF